MPRSSQSESVPSNSSSMNAARELLDALKSSTLFCASNVVNTWNSAIKTSAAGCRALVDAYRPQPAQRGKKLRQVSLSDIRSRMKKLTPAKAVEAIFSSVSSVAAFSASLLMVAASTALVAAYAVAYSVLMVCINLAYTASIAFGAGSARVTMGIMEDIGRKKSRNAIADSETQSSEPIYVNVAELASESLPKHKSRKQHLKEVCKDIAIGIVGACTFVAVFIPVAAVAAFLVVASPVSLVAASIYEVVALRKSKSVNADGIRRNTMLAGTEKTSTPLESIKATEGSDIVALETEIYGATEKVAHGARGCSEPTAVPGWDTPAWPDEVNYASSPNTKTNSTFCYESGGSQSVFGQTRYRHVHDMDGIDGPFRGSNSNDGVGTKLRCITTESFGRAHGSEGAIAATS